MTAFETKNNSNKKNWQNKYFVISKLDKMRNKLSKQNSFAVLYILIYKVYDDVMKIVKSEPEVTYV